MKPLLTSLVFLAAITAAPAKAAPVVPEDLFKLTFLSSAAISPNATYVLVEASKAVGPKNTYDRTIDLVDVATGTLRANVTGRAGDGDFAWMPDDRSFVFVRALPKQKGQLYRYDLASGKIVQLMHFKQGVSSPVVSHDGTRIAERAVSFLQSENLAADFAGKNGLGGGYYTWGPPWDPASTLYAEFSPLTFVEKVRTPLLILHADGDTGAPIDQTLQEFTALKVLGRTVVYVAVPNENHDLSRTGAPIHRVESLHIIAAWLNEYLMP